MKTDDILALARAGFSAMQIAALAAQPATPVATPVATPAATPANNDPYLTAILSLTSAVQANGILNSQQPAVQSTDDILASVINPTFKTEEGSK